MLVCVCVYIYIYIYITGNKYVYENVFSWLANVSTNTMLNILVLRPSSGHVNY